MNDLNSQKSLIACTFFQPKLERNEKKRKGFGKKLQGHCAINSLYS